MIPDPIGQFETGGYRNREDGRRYIPVNYSEGMPVYGVIFDVRADGDINEACAFAERLVAALNRHDMLVAISQGILAAENYDDIEAVKQLIRNTHRLEELSGENTPV